MVRRTKAEALATRDQLLDAAEQIFSQNGVANTSLQEIAQHAGVTRGAFYWHFKDKAELIGALMERVMMPLDELQEQAKADNPADLVQQIRNDIIIMLQRITTDAHLKAVVSILLLKCEYTEAVDDIRQRFLRSREECAEDLETRIGQAIALGQLPKAANPKLTVIALFSLVDGLLFNWLIDPEAFDLHQNAEALIKPFFDGLLHA